MRFWRLIRWVEESDKRKEYKGLPRGCWDCEVLGLCRRLKEESKRKSRCMKYTTAFDIDRKMSCIEYYQKSDCED